MNITIQELTDTTAKFVLSDADPTLANALRRTLIADIPKLAIEDVEFHLGPIRDEDGNEYESISPLFDETISHRLGLIPLPTDLKLFEFKNKCKCNGEGCPSCTVLYSLNKKGPCTVYSGDLEPVGDAKLRAADDLIPIVKLGEGQALLIYATAVLGTGKDHAKWSVAHGVGYKYFPSIRIDQKKCDKVGGCIKKCPQNILKMDGGKVIIESPDKCTMCNACVQVCTNKAITVTGDETKFLFQFETDGSMSAAVALKTALDILMKKFSGFRDGLAELQE